MKFKKNDKILIVKTYDNAKIGMTGKIRGFSKEHREYIVFFPEMLKGGRGHDCKGVIPEGGGHYIPEDCMELLMTFPQKLEKFKTERVGFHVDTKEIADELQKVFDKEKLNGSKRTMDEAWDSYGNYKDFYVTYNYGSDRKLRYGVCGSRYDTLNEILPITLEELKEYNSTLTITITSDGYHRTTAESNGVTAEALCNPTDTFDISKGSHIALKRLLEKLDDGTPWKLGDLSDKTEGFHVGDIVEVIGNEWGFTKNPVGLQGFVTRPNKKTSGAQVKLPNSDESQYFFARELKLVRKYNA